MYEIERTFLFDDGFLQKLAKLGKLESEERLIDKYYDTEDFAWLSKAHWLRERSGEWELKIYGNDGNGTSMSREITDESEIMSLMDLPRVGLKKAVAESNLQEFAALDSVRRKYLLDGLHIDIDDTKAEGFRYRVGEVEALVTRQDEMDLAKEKVINFMKTHKLGETRVRGKILEYLWQMKPDVYDLLLKRGVIKGF